MTRPNGTPSTPAAHPVFLQPGLLVLPFDAHTIRMRSLELVIRARWQTRSGIQLGWREIAFQPGIPPELIARGATEAIIAGTLGYALELPDGSVRQLIPVAEMRLPTAKLVVAVGTPAPPPDSATPPPEQRIITP